jgi:DNA-damage-inducible protein D
MNADSRKAEVAKAQAYFAALADSFRQYCEEAENVLRIQIRSEISGREKSLSGVAKEAGVINYQYFQNAGYRGMYNRNLNEIRALKHVPSDRSPLDFMGKTELAANLFRITQTEAKIKGENIKGQKQCEVTAEQVGQVVRKTMKQISGQTPESLPPAHDIKEVKKELKETHKKLKKIDTNRNNTKSNR